MASITITEALAEIKTINARLGKKREAVVGFLVRDKRVVDPLLNQPEGSIGWIKREQQAILDLEKRIVKIRTAIQASNLTAILVVSGVALKVAEWLTWRREVAGARKSYLNTMVGTIKATRQEAAKKGYRLVQDPAPAENEAVVNVDEAALAREIETMEEVLGELDGKLSLFNATTVIEI